MESWAWIAAGATMAAGLWSTIKSWAQQCHLLLFDDAIVCVRPQDVNYHDLSLVWTNLLAGWTPVTWTHTFISLGRTNPAVAANPDGKIYPMWMMLKLPPMNVKQLYRQGWRLLWVEHTPNEDRMRLWTIRGTVDLDTLVSRAIPPIKEKAAHACYYVTYSKGTAGERGDDIFGRRGGNGGSEASPSGNSPATTSRDNKPAGSGLWWQAETGLCRLINTDSAELAARLQQQSTCEARLAYTDVMKQAREDYRQWLYGQEWYADRQIAWRRGWQLRGAPGNGKTTFVDALGREFGVPVCHVDLASMRNGELRKCSDGYPPGRIMLFDDVDCVFHGRDNISKLEGSLTFDNFLQWLDSEHRDGALVVLVTNHAELLDPALTDRPGRIDRQYFIGPPDAAGRQKVADWILGPNHPATARLLTEWTVAEHNGNAPTVANVAETCRTIALQDYWDTYKRQST